MANPPDVVFIDHTMGMCEVEDLCRNLRFADYVGLIVVLLPQGARSCTEYKDAEFRDAHDAELLHQNVATLIAQIYARVGLAA